MRPLRVCGQPGCPELTDTGRCPAHAREPWSGSTRHQRLPGDWAARRQRVLRRDRGRCHRCGAPATQVDHLVAGDDHRLANLAAICGPCHAAKSSQEGHRARRTS